MGRNTTDRELDDRLDAYRDAKASTTDPTLSRLERQYAAKAATEEADAVAALLRR